MSRPKTDFDALREDLRRVYDGEPWHGSSIRDVLKGVDADTAALRTIPNAHNIWELVLHMTAWEDVVRRRLLGESPDITDEQNWPEVKDPCGAGWTRALGVLRAGHTKLRETAAGISDSLLDQSPTGKHSTRYVLLHGIIQHDIYHAGQISILKKE